MNLEDMPIESGMLTAVWKALRKRLKPTTTTHQAGVWYDEVMNNQRRAICCARRVLEGQDLKEQVIKYAENDG